MPAAGPASSPDGDPPPRHLLVAALVALVTLVCAIATATADAEEVFTSQAAAANATDSTWIPAPPKPAALCIVDTGNDLNPDTSNVIARFSVDGGDPGDLSPDHHGTLMSMIAAAPYNGFGMVGAAPSINIVSVRASRDGRTFGGNDLTSAVQICVNKRAIYNIKAVSLSLGGAAITRLDAAAMATAEDTVESARRVGLNVVAAAGNHAGPVDWPAAYRPVLAVGAADNSGGRCPFSASGSEVDVWAPGCPVDAASPNGSAVWLSGSSEATAFVAAVLTQLRQLRPALNEQEVEALMRRTGRPLMADVVLDVGSAFAVAGLSHELADAHAHAPIESSASSNDSSSDLRKSEHSNAPVISTVAAPVNLAAPAPASLKSRMAIRTLPRPTVIRFSLRRSLFSARLKNWSPGIEVSISIYARRSDRSLPRLVRSVRTKTSVLRIRVRGAITQVAIAYRDPTARRSRSSSLYLHPRR